MNSQMMRVISSPSSSTTGFATLILSAMRRATLAARQLGEPLAGSDHVLLAEDLPAGAAPLGIDQVDRDERDLVGPTAICAALDDVAEAPAPVLGLLDREGLPAQVVALGDRPQHLDELRAAEELLPQARAVVDPAVVLGQQIVEEGPVTLVECPLEPGVRMLRRRLIGGHELVEPFARGRLLVLGEGLAVRAAPVRIDQVD